MCTIHLLLDIKTENFYIADLIINSYEIEF